MAYRQLVNPDLTTVGNVGWCLSMQEDVWRTPHLYTVYPNNTATYAWNQTKYRHEDWNLPSDVAVPIWFTYWEDGINYGHVATNVPGRGVLSSPYKADGTQWWFSSIQQCEAVLNCTYVGWSEDIANVRVVQPQEDSSVAIIEDADNWYGRVAKTVKLVEGRDMSRDEFKYWVGQDFLHLAEATEDSDGAQQHLADAQFGAAVRSDDWQGQLQQYADKVAALQAAVDAANSDDTKTKAQLQDALVKVTDLTTQLTQLQEQPAVVTSDQVPTADPQQNAAFSSLVDFLKRLLGIK